MNKKYLGLLASAGAVCVPAMASAAGPTLSDVLVNSGITASGYVDASYVDGFNKGSVLGANATSAVGGRAFDTSSNTFTFNQAALNIGYLPTEGFGGFVNVIAGQDAKVINGSYGDDTGTFSLTQAYVQYATGNLTVIAGRYVTLAGYEVINSTLDTNVSRSLLFQNLEPLVHTGVRASYKIGDPLTVYLGLNNSAAYGQAGDDNKQKTLEAGGLFTPSKAISVGLYEYYGFDENAGGVLVNTPAATQKTSYTDLTASWQITDPLSVALNADYVKKFSIDGDPAAPGSQAYGVAGYVNYAFLSNLKGSLRGEYLKYKDSTGYSENDNEVTLTLDYSPATNFDLLGEVRLDGSANNIYPNGDADLKGTESDVAIKAIWKFGTPTGS